MRSRHRGGTQPFLRAGTRRAFLTNYYNLKKTHGFASYPEQRKIKKPIISQADIDLLSIDLIGVVPDDEFIITQTNKGEPVVSNKKAPSGKAYVEISRRILGENIEVSVPGREKGIMAKVKNIFSKK